MAFKTGTATDYLDLVEKLEAFALAQKVTGVAVTAGGTGYSVGNVLTLSGGTPETAATFTVASVDGGTGAVLTVTLLAAGLYCNGSTPASPAATTVVPAGGTGCTLTPTWGAALGWATQRKSKEAVSATIQAGGSGYAVNDLITLSGGVGVVQAPVFRVDTIGGGGAVTAVSLWKRGNIAVPPANAVATTATTGAGTSCTLNVTWQTVTAVAGTSGVVSAVVAAGGTGYAPGNILTVSGGTQTTTAQFIVLTVNAGAVLTVAPYRRGSYTVKPSNPAATTGGNGNCTLTLTWEDLQPNPDKELILLGDGGGTMTIYVGIKSISDPSGTGACNWELAGMSGYAAGSAWDAQPGISPGRASLAQNGAFVPLRNNTLTYWFMVTNRRIIGVVKVGTSMYSNFYIGLLNPFGTSTEYPYPLAIFGCSGVWNTLYSTANGGLSGLVDPTAPGSGLAGPAFLRDIGGNWISIQNAQWSGTQRNELKVNIVFPCGRIPYISVPTEDKCTSNQCSMMQFIAFGSPGTASTWRLKQTPGPVTILIPNFIAQSSPSFQMFGELDNIFWCSVEASPSNVTSEDTITIGSDVYLVFQNCQRTDVYSYLAIKRE